MKQTVMLSLRSQQRYEEQEPEVLELVTEGTMEFRDGGWEISYAESALTGLEGVTTTFRVEPDQVTLRRTGQLKSEMVFRSGLSHDSLYEMPFGALLLTVQTTSLFYDLVPDGGSIDLSYRVIVENAPAGEIDYHLDIRAK
ncbi:MAG: DUF1934 domain-containing protein [Candidatus Faecousia sp.]|nr:DUF1934 domain-containing protein [Candidatus Faecousia sp.]